MGQAFREAEAGVAPDTRFTDSVLFPSRGPSKCARRHPTAAQGCHLAVHTLSLWAPPASSSGCGKQHWRAGPARQPRLPRPPTLAAHHPPLGRGPALQRPPHHPHPSLAAGFQCQLPVTLPFQRALPGQLVPARPPSQIPECVCPSGSTGDGREPGKVSREEGH